MKYSIPSVSRDDVLSAIGLAPRRTVADLMLPALGVFGGGLLIGAGLGVLFAPRSGAHTRGALRNGLGGLRRRLGRSSHGHDHDVEADLDQMSTDFDCPAGSPQSPI